jgi:uncharacterized protein YndB with AHSA1/START domain
MADQQHQIPIQAPPEKVYAALTTSEGLRGWWTADSKAEAKPGGKAEFGFDKRGMVFRMMIEKLEPGRLVVWRCMGDHPEWDGTSLTWKISSENGTTMLRFTHGDWKGTTDFYALCNSTWGELMYRLKDYVEGRNPGPHWKD